MSRTEQAIAAGGLTAAALDIIYAFVVYGPLSYGLSPMQVLQSVAAGWLGRDLARAGGWETATLGAATHILIALTMATVFVFAARKIASLAARPVIAGLGYGLILYIVMNYVVVPLSAAHKAQRFPMSLAEAIERLQVAVTALRPDDPMMLLGTMLTHTVFVGLPIAVAANRLLARADAQ